MSKTQKGPNVEALEEAASVIQREEQKVIGENPPRGAGSKAKSLADRTADAMGQPQGVPKKVDPEAIDEAARTIQREESKVKGGETPAGGAASAAQSFAHKAAMTQDN